MGRHLGCAGQPIGSSTHHNFNFMCLIHDHHVRDMSVGAVGASDITKTKIQALGPKHCAHNVAHILVESAL